MFNPNADENQESAVKLEPISRTKIETPTVTILGSVQPKYSDIMKAVNKYGFTIEDVLDIARVSVIMHDISRPISMQVNRHRNAITQESQRYVDYSKKAFINPLKYHDTPEMLEKKFKLSLFGTNFELSGQELGNRLCKIYHQLIEQGMKKQDARSFLPSNVCTRLIMTFTYKNLFHFLNLRLDKASQPEIRNLSNDLLKAFNEYDKGMLSIYERENVEIPYYIIEDKKRESDSLDIDEILSEEEI
jgi:flavin-dependent thymidylate synthase